MKKIGILTSGGDCGGLNAVLKGAACAALGQGIQPVLILGGYAGLYNLGDRESLLELTPSRIDRIDPLLAGSEAGNSRVKIAKIPDAGKYERIKANLKHRGIEGLVIGGGDDTGSVAVDLAAHGIPCVHVPKTMDIDLSTYSVGGDSTVNRIATFISDLKTTGRSHSRIMVVEIFGRYAGHTTFRGGLAGDADCILIPEIKADLDLVYAHMRETFLRRLAESDTRTATYVIAVAECYHDATGGMLTQEGVKIDAFGHKKLGGSGRHVREHLAARIAKDERIIAAMKRYGLYVEGMNEAPEVREVVPGYLVRSGPSSALDANYGRDLGLGAVYLLMEGLSGVTVTGIRGGTVRYIRSEDAIRSRTVDERLVSLYERSGVFFGRTPVAAEPVRSECDAAPWNYI
jgi:6-phosphofructokinase 1